MRNIIVGVGVVGIASIIVLACSASDDTESPTNTTKTGAESSDATPAPSSPPTNQPPPPPASTCSNAQGEEPCWDCCDAKNPGGAETFDQAMRTCACAEDVCATECAESLCAETPIEPAAGDECSTCMAGAVQCGEQAATACAANAACARLADCLDKSGCVPDTDEEDDGGS